MTGIVDSISHILNENAGDLSTRSTQLLNHETFDRRLTRRIEDFHSSASERIGTIAWLGWAKLLARSEGVLQRSRRRGSVKRSSRNDEKCEVVGRQCRPAQRRDAGLEVLSLVAASQEHDFRLHLDWNYYELLQFSRPGPATVGLTVSPVDPKPR